MSIGLLFWILFIVCVVFGGINGRAWGWSQGGIGILLAVLLFLLGWGVFGFALHR